ncbi:MAG: hypothetical protein AB7G06_01505 [Bdellovibrionales bacterium]
MLKRRRIYAIGHINGRSDLLEAMLVRINQDCADFQDPIAVVFTGNYIGSAPGGRKVLERMCALASRRAECYFLRGRQEQDLLDCIYSNAGVHRMLHWMQNEGAALLQDYNIDVPAVPFRETRFNDAETTQISATQAALQKALRQSARPGSQTPLMFLSRTPLQSAQAGLLFCSAGVNPFKTLLNQNSEDLTLRHAEYSESAHHGLDKILVHGGAVPLQPGPQAWPDNAQPHTVNVDNSDSGTLSAGVFDMEWQDGVDTVWTIKPVRFIDTAPKPIIEPQAVLDSRGAPMAYDF